MHDPGAVFACELRDSCLTTYIARVELHDADAGIRPEGIAYSLRGIVGLASCDAIYTERPCARKLASVEARIEPKKRGEGKTALIVDDNPLVCKAIESTFLSDGFEVCVAAENGDLAIEVAKECRPDLIILDLSMPLWNGLQAAPMLRRLFPKAPIFLYSLYADALDIRIEGRVFCLGWFRQHNRTGQNAGSTSTRRGRSGVDNLRPTHGPQKRFNA
jgi:CheY-like chemotaxis protein